MACSQYDLMREIVGLENFFYATMKRRRWRRHHQLRTLQLLYLELAFSHRFARSPLLGRHGNIALFK